MNITRRQFAAAGAAAAILPRAWAQDSFQAAVAAIEARAGGRLGVALFDTGTGRVWGYKKSERFAMCSTFKLMLVAAVLWRADAMKVPMTDTTRIPNQPLIGNSPRTAEHAGATMTLADLCAATITVSDNTAANLLLERIGGPDGYTTFLRAIGDQQTRLDRTEPTLNESKPGDPRDTTTPIAMLASMNKVVLGDVLQPASRDRLLGWMLASTTGLDCLRAGMPATWKVADKTGSDGATTRNEIAVLFPGQGKATALATVYLTECPGTDAKRNAVLAEVGKLIATTLA